MHAFEVLEKCSFGFNGPLETHLPKKRCQCRIAAGVFDNIPGDVNAAVENTDTFTEDLRDCPSMCVVTIANKNANAGMVLEEEQEKPLK